MGTGLKIRMVVGRAIVTWNPWSGREPASSGKTREVRLPFANDNTQAVPLKLRVVSRRG